MTLLIELGGCSNVRYQLDAWDMISYKCEALSSFSSNTPLAVAKIMKKYLIKNRDGIYDSAI